MERRVGSPRLKAEEPRPLPQVGPGVEARIGDQAKPDASRIQIKSEPVLGKPETTPLVKPAKRWGDIMEEEEEKSQRMKSAEVSPSPQPLLSVTDISGGVGEVQRSERISSPEPSLRPTKPSATTVAVKLKLPDGDKKLVHIERAEIGDKGAYQAVLEPMLLPATRGIILSSEGKFQPQRSSKPSGKKVRRSKTVEPSSWRSGGPVRSNARRPSQGEAKPKALPISDRPGRGILARPLKAVPPDPKVTEALKASGSAWAASPSLLKVQKEAVPLTALRDKDEL
jgi:hypothetical protein